jgi:hypothetical protein
VLFESCVESSTVKLTSREDWGGEGGEGRERRDQLLLFRLELQMRSSQVFQKQTLHTLTFSSPSCFRRFALLIGSTPSMSVRLRLIRIGEGVSKMCELFGSMECLFFEVGTSLGGRYFTNSRLWGGKETQLTPQQSLQLDLLLDMSYIN